MEITILRSRRKTLALQVGPDGRILARAPLQMPESEIIRFAESKRPWLEKTQARVTAEERQAEAAGMFTPDELDRAARQTARLLTERLAYYAPLLGVTYRKVSVRKQHSRWGSCNTRGDLSFNSLLALVPREVLDYVVVHELCHRKHMDHSPAFWQAVKNAFPDYENARRWLNTDGLVLLRRLP